MMEKMDSTNLAWAAGLFEGEGCITRHNNGRTPAKLKRLVPVEGRRDQRGRPRSEKPLPTLGVSIAMTDEDVLRRFAGIVGHGSIGEHTPDTKYKKQWRWTVYSDNAREVITLLWPWLGSRRRARAVELWDVTVNRNEVPLP